MFYKKDAAVSQNQLFSDLKNDYSFDADHIFVHKNIRLSTDIATKQFAISSDSGKSYSIYSFGQLNGYYLREKNSYIKDRKINYFLICLIASLLLGTVTGFGLNLEAGFKFGFCFFIISIFLVLFSGERFRKDFSRQIIDICIDDINNLNYSIVFSGEDEPEAEKDFLNFISLLKYIQKNAH